MVKLEFNIGKTKLTFDADNSKMAHMISDLYGSLPNKCDCCNSEDVYLSHKNIKENEYFGIKCKSCGAELSFHQKKTGGFYVIDGEKMTVYKGKSDQALPPVGNNPQQVVQSLNEF